MTTTTRKPARKATATKSAPATKTTASKTTPARKTAATAKVPAQRTPRRTAAPKTTLVALQVHATLAGETKNSYVYTPNSGDVLMNGKLYLRKDALEGTEPPASFTFTFDAS